MVTDELQKKCIVQSLNESYLAIRETKMMLKRMARNINLCLDDIHNRLEAVERIQKDRS